MDCPSCGRDCIRPADEVLAAIDNMYMACGHCSPEPNLDKTAPLRDLPRDIARCEFCKKAPLDAVMLEALRVLQEAGLRDEKDGLRSVGSPLIAYGFPIAYPPRLGARSLIITGEGLDREAAREMVRRVPEVRGVIMSRGVPGVRDGRAYEAELLAGCDTRADVVSSIFGDVVVYKSQSKIHIEFPRERGVKVQRVERLLLGGAKEVADGLCGPGTLGMICILGGAKRVVMNDIWLPAIENVMINLEANRRVLGLDGVERLQRPREKVGDQPVLVGRASGSCEIEVYHGRIEKLFSAARPADLCLVDAFPGMDVRGIEKACGVCKKVAII